MCDDPLVVTLNRLGYVPVRYPDSTIAPFLFLCRLGKNSKTLGRIDNFAVNNTVTLPSLTNQNIVKPDYAGQTSNNIKLSVNGEVLESFLCAMGAKSFSLKTISEKVDSVKFVYQKVLRDYIDPRVLEVYLNNLVPDTKTQFFPNINGPGKSFVINDILKSSSFGIKLCDKTGLDIDLKLPAIKEVVDIFLNLGFSRVEENTIIFSGEQFLTFAFNAIMVWMTDGASPKFMVRLAAVQVIKPLKMVLRWPPREETELPQDGAPGYFGEKTLVDLTPASQ